MARDIPQWLGLPGQPWTRQLTDGVRAGGRRAAAAVSTDWATGGLFSYGVGVALLTCAAVAMFLINKPAPFLPYHDSHEYIASANRILNGESWADPQRLPGYPVFLAVIFALFGSDNLVAAQLAQMALFVLTTVEVYALGYLVWKNTRYAALIAVLVGTNVYFVEFARPILSDGLALWITTSLALAVAVFIKRPAAWRLWLVAALTLTLFMTRGEWYLLPIPLFAYLLFVSHRRKKLLHLLPHAFAALVLLYSVMFGYIAMNAHVNGVAQLTSDENINLYGKVTQYNMQGEAPPQYADIMRVTERYVNQRHLRDPWRIYWSDPELGRDNFSAMGAYARSIIERHPLQFLGDSVPVALNSLYNSYQFGGINRQQRMAKPLTALLSFSAIPYGLFLLFPLCAAWWLLALAFRRRSRHRLRSELLGALIVLSLYDLVMTTLGSYNEYGRLHLGFDPLMLVVVVGSILLFAGSQRHTRSRDTHIRTRFVPPSESRTRTAAEQPAA